MLLKKTTFKKILLFFFFIYFFMVITFLLYIQAFEEYFDLQDFFIIYKLHYGFQFSDDGAYDAQFDRFEINPHCQ